MIFCALLYNHVLDKCVCASAEAMTLAVVPHHVIRVNVMSHHQFSPKYELDNVSGNLSAVNCI